MRRHTFGSGNRTSPRRWPDRRAAAVDSQNVHEASSQRPSGAFQRRILHPCDFSPASGPAFGRAVDMAKRGGAELLVLHVLAPFVPRFGERYASPQTYNEIERPARLSGSSPSCSAARRPPSGHLAKRRSLVHGEVRRRIALDQILRHVSRCVYQVTLEPDRTRDLLSDGSAHATRLGVPAHVVAPLEFGSHRRALSSYAAPARVSKQAPSSSASTSCSIADSSAISSPDNRRLKSFGPVSRLTVPGASL